MNIEYQDYFPLIKQQAARAARRGVEYTEAISQCNELYVKAVNTYQEEHEVSFSTWLYHCLQRVIRNCNRGRRKEEFAEDLQVEGSCEPVEPFCLELGKHGKIMVNTVLTMPEELQRLADEAGDLNLGVITAYFRKQGWKYNTIRKTIYEIQHALRRG